MFIVVSCSTDPMSDIQGVYEVDKEAPTSYFDDDPDNENAFLSDFINDQLENALIEFSFEGDSVRGVFSFVGEEVVIESQISRRNDSLIINTPDFEAYILPSDKGLIYGRVDSDITVQLTKTERDSLSTSAREVIEEYKAEIREKQEFEQNLGKWKKGYYVDEFGDRTGEEYVYCLVRGSNENSVLIDSEVYVKIMVEDESLSFQVFNSSISMRESFPDSSSGIVKFKLPDGTVKKEDFFFYHDSAYEGGDATLFNSLLKTDEAIKVLLDLSTANEYYSDKYQFEIQRGNLGDLLFDL